MEEQILEILDDNTNIDYGGCEADWVNKYNAAKEIAAHFMEFIEWLGRKCEPVMVGHFNYDENEYITNQFWKIIGEDGNYPTETLYQYWLTNVKK